MFLQKFYKCYENLLGNCFERYGVIACNYPYTLICFCVLLNCLSGLGFLRFSIETDMERLYTPANNEALRNMKIIDSTFPDMSRNFFQKALTNTSKHMYGGIIFKTKDGSNILTLERMAEVRHLDKIIRQEVVFPNASGSMLKLNDVCATSDGKCAVSGDFVLNGFFPALVDARQISFPYIAGISISNIFGDTQVEDGKLVSASMIRLVYHLRQDSQLAKLHSHLWETSFVNKMKTIKTNSTEITFRHSVSVTEEFRKSIFGERKYFILTLIFMVIYAAFAVSGGNCVSGRVTLAIAGIISTCLALVGSFGVVSALGVQYINICGVIPFLIIGIGLDDMFVLMSCLSATPHTMSVADRIKRMMRTGGVAITVTSLTDFLAFIVGSASVFPSVQYFCDYTGVAVLFCFMNQLLFFVPCMVINERRTYANRHCVTCMVTSSYDELRTRKRSFLYRLCCGGEPSKNGSDAQSPVEKYPKRLIQRIISIDSVKISTLLAMIGYLGVSFYGAINVDQKFFVSSLVPDHTYIHKYLTLTETHFTNEIIVSFVLTNQLDYSNNVTQNKIAAMLTEARREPIMQATREINWLLAYKNSEFYKDSRNFTVGLKPFLASQTEFKTDVVFDDTGKNIIASRFYVASKSISSSESTKLLMTSMRSVAKNSGLHAIVHAPLFILGEQFLSIGPTTLQTVLVGMSAMLLVTIVTVPQPVIVSVVCTGMVSILTGVYGFLYLWNLSLSSVTMIELIMSIGFSVNFSAHICHAYITSTESSRLARVNDALNRVGGAILNGALSSIVGVVLLEYASSYIFQSFFKVMFLVITFGLLHALLFLPVALLFCGPIDHDSNDDKDEQTITSTKVTTIEKSGIKYPELPSSEKINQHITYM